MAIATFDDPDDLVLRDGWVQCATFKPDPNGEYMLAPSTGGPPEPCKAVYYAVPGDATEDELREIAFEIREGKPMEPYQRWALHEAKKMTADA
jgi:hypothetical protein